MPFETELGAKGLTVAAGSAGGLVAALAMQGSLTARIIAGVAGALSAIFVGPLASALLTAKLKALNAGWFANTIPIDPVQVATFTGFIIGLSGIRIAVTVQVLVDAGRRKAVRKIDQG
jgi:hypothetical protein